MIAMGQESQEGLAKKPFKSPWSIREVIPEATERTLELSSNKTQQGKRRGMHPARARLTGQRSMQRVGEAPA